MLRTLVPVVLLLVVVAIGWLATDSPDVREGASAPVESGRIETASSAFEARRSDVWIEDRGTVVALLRDDDEGSRHQRFLVLLGGGSTLLVVHNIDLAPRVPVEKGDEVTVRGEYVWNDKGGLVHWTHHDPEGQRPGGWVRHKEQEYR